MIVLAELLAEIRGRAEAWHDAEINATRQPDSGSAEKHRLRAAVLEQLANDLEDRAFERVDVTSPSESPL